MTCLLLYLNTNDPVNIFTRWLFFGAFLLRAGGNPTYMKSHTNSQTWFRSPYSNAPTDTTGSDTNVTGIHGLISRLGENARRTSFCFSQLNDLTALRHLSFSNRSHCSYCDFRSTAHTFFAHTLPVHRALPSLFHQPRISPSYFWLSCASANFSLSFISF